MSALDCDIQTLAGILCPLLPAEKPDGTERRVTGRKQTHVLPHVRWLKDCDCEREKTIKAVLWLKDWYLEEADSGCLLIWNVTCHCVNTTKKSLDGTWCSSGQSKQLMCCGLYRSKWERGNGPMYIIFKGRKSRVYSTYRFAKVYLFFWFVLKLCVSFLVFSLIFCTLEV